jgi:hypothetical protein
MNSVSSHISSGSKKKAPHRSGGAKSIHGGNQSLWRFLISFRSSRAIISVTLNSLAYGPRHSCLSPWYADLEKYHPFGRFSTVYISRA